ncbi:MAG: hypothetical protein Q8930_01275 [Bacillota bacterium]|nr:hypothetical protein [Bacillota bacterium]
MEGNNFNPNNQQNNNTLQNGDVSYNQNAGYNQYQGYNQNGMYNQGYTYNQPYIEARLKHSGLGIASFVMSLVLIFGYFIIFAASASLALNEDTTEGQFAVIGLGVIFLMILSVVALILGIVGTALKNRKKGFAIAGLIINSLSLLAMIAVIAIGIVNNNRISGL